VGALIVFLEFFAAPAFAQDPCDPIQSQFNGLVERYLDAGRKAIENMDPPEAVTKARDAALRGEHQATLVLVGVPLLMRSRAEMFQLTTLRQICGFAHRNQHPLHIATCAYFNALNPIGEAVLKRQLVEREIERFSALGDRPERDPGLRRAMEVLEACIATRPER
jgi:hypothetical protein